ncbi:Alpha/Beta hydrolase protein [Xylogone sp. PMI_703]|nr:Alpha/Beta hydrolase protein [Xylogone sp. PMI_703]
MAIISRITVVLSAIWAVNATHFLPVVSLASGVVIGTTTSVPSAIATVNQFLGVPFAAPPERFSPPSKPRRWKKPLDASSRSPACIQQINYPESRRNFTNIVFNNPVPQESEDCLYLNIFAPSTAPPPGGYAVLFWIYGGSLQFGNAGQPLYDGSYFAAFEDVIVVAANYRTNVFGFPSSPKIPLAHRNLGFLDQRCALEWVRDNIKSFGGNPAKVTIFGESAGATSIDALVTSWAHNPPFRAAILESGQSTLPIVSAVGINSTESWIKLTAALNCTHARSSLSCVKAANVSTIQSILEHTPLVFRPAIDGFTVIHNATAARAAHNVADILLMAGTNGQEGRAFVYGQTNLTAFLLSLPGMTSSLQAAITKAYPPGDFGTTNDFEIIAQIYTDLVVACPEASVVSQSAAAGYSTWRYYYNATFPNQQVLPDLGAYHFSEIAQVFSTYPANFTAQQFALSNYMRGAWARFAKNPRAGPGWNAIGTFGGVDLGVLGANGSSGVQVIKPEVIDVNCHIFAPIYEAASTALRAQGSL